MTRSLLLASLLLAIPVKAAPACPPIAHVELVLKPGARIVLGEIHGNEETPRFVAAMACRAAKLGAVRIGLEIPKDEQARIDAFLTSGNRAALLSGAFWTDRYQDGRRSQAMAALLESLHHLRARGTDVKVVAFDVPGADREQQMADRLSAAFAAEPKATFVVLVGNLHARKTPGQFAPNPMVQRLIKRGVRLTSLNAHYGAGTSWVCTGDQPDTCRPESVGDDSAGTPAIVLASSADGAYNGTFEAGPATFSPPAAINLTAVQKRRVDEVRLTQRAQSERDHKRYRQCAVTLLALAELHDDVHGGAYEAAGSCYALAGDRNRAFQALSQAVSAGDTDAEGIARDPDLASLHGDARWRPLLDRMRGAKHASSHLNPALRATLVKMYQDDQSEALGRMSGKSPASHVQERIALLKQIIAKYGWPGISLVGDDGADGAFVVAQHADEDLPFQQQCLALLEKAYTKGDATGFQLAYLTDRVLTAEHKQQLYGTQSSPQFSPKEKAEVEARRKRLGLPTLAEGARRQDEVYDEIVHER